MSVAHPLALERNLALMAGAGAGKTHGLVTVALHLLAGAREGRFPARPKDCGDCGYRAVCRISARRVPAQEEEP